MSFDTVIMVDWSGGNDRGATPKKDAIWTCLARGGVAEDPVYLRNRQVAEEWIIAAIAAEHAAGRRVLLGFDLCFSFPRGFAKALTGDDDPLALWDWFAERVEDSPKANNRFDLGGEINAMFPGEGPFWYNGLQRDIPHLPRTQQGYTDQSFAATRATDAAAKGAQSPFKLGGAGAVGGQVIMGLPMLSRLRHRFGTDLCVWPFETAEAPILLAETYFSLLDEPLDGHAIKDAAQVALYAARFSGLGDAQWSKILDRPPDPEGWVLGLGQEHLLTPALTPPPLRNDCFAMPQGAYWTPVEKALRHLRENLKPVVPQETMALADAAGRVLAQDVIAKRSHPPAANAAVDGYGFAGPIPTGPVEMPLVDGRAAAGAPYPDEVPAGYAIRILTGAILPRGVDTIVLQEDVTANARAIAFHGPLKQGVNARKAGEDMQAGDTVMPAGRVLTPADLGTLAAVGIGEVAVFAPLRVGVLSTGDELLPPGAKAHDGQVYDANGPMLRATLARWGFEVVDLGRAPDNRTALSEMLDQAATRCDAILTSGGASGGDEDHVSALLQETGSFALWRVAVKPGRPLVMGLWQGVPVLGLPGNPVAAQVCTLIFARPALMQLAGAGWRTATGYDLPADFAKSKKDGRREYLRARVTDGRVEVFPSEGSGRISGLSWADGLVELPDAAVTIHPGDRVRFLPFASFGL